MEHHQQAALRFHQPGHHQRHQFKKTPQVGVTAQGERQGSEKLVIAALFAAEAVEKLAQRGLGRQRLRHGGAGGGRGGLDGRLGRLAAQGAAAVGIQISNGRTIRELWVEDPPRL